MIHSVAEAFLLLDCDVTAVSPVHPEADDAAEATADKGGRRQVFQVVVRVIVIVIVQTLEAYNGSRQSETLLQVRTIKAVVFCSRR